MNLWKSYIRWRHSKGYGVHSPYAWRFVCDVVRPGVYGYYAYDLFESFLHEKERRDYKFLRLIRFSIRLVNFLKPERLIASDGSRIGDLLGRTLTIPRKITPPSPDCEFTDKDLLIVERTIDGNLLRDAVAANAMVFAVNPAEEVRQILLQPLEKGLLLADNRCVILVPRREMEYTSYEIALKFRY